MMALTQEKVHYTLNSGPGVMNKSNRVHARIQEFLSGGGGGGGRGSRPRRPVNSLDNVFFSHQLILQFTEWIQWFYYRGEDAWGPTSSRGWGCPKKPINLVIFEGGSGPPNPPSGPARWVA